MSLANIDTGKQIRLSRRQDLDDSSRATPIFAMPSRAPAAPAGNFLDEAHPLHLIDRVVRSVFHETAGTGFRLGEARDAGQSDRERMIRSLLLQILYSIPCDWHLLEQMRYDIRFRWFVGLDSRDQVWSQDVHASARGAILRSGAERQLFSELLRGLRPITRIVPHYFSFDENLVDRWHANLHATAPIAAPPSLSIDELLKAAGVSGDPRQIDSRLIRALEWILTRACMHDLNSNSLAAAVGMSRRSLYYLFDAYQLTPTMAIRNIRLEHCKRLMEDARHSQRTITAIALDYGFSSLCSFSRSFKQRYGIVPRDCRSAGSGSIDRVDA